MAKSNDEDEREVTHEVVTEMEVVPVENKKTEEESYLRKQKGFNYVYINCNFLKKIYINFKKECNIYII